MNVKPYPQPVVIKGIEYPSRFYQELADGTVGPKEAKPEVPAGKFVFNIQKNNFLSVTFEEEKTDPAEPSKNRAIAPYIPSEDIREIVRLAQILKRPVLIKGEPGSGKTQLSRAVAYEWYHNEYQQHYFEWFVKSTTKAADGLYSFDHVARLRDAQLAQIKPALGNKDNRDYRKFGPMALAFLTSTKENPSILLIDEIDKADIDFPNDLLLELDERRFTIPESETGETIAAAEPPVIFITSNDERELPEAFLRRCIFLYMDFPDDKQMRLIIQAHLPELVKEQNKFTKEVIAAIKNPKPITPKDFIDLANIQFGNLRRKRKDDLVDSKRVSTSELIDWLTAFNYDWLHKSGIYQDARKLIGEYIGNQLDSDKAEADATNALKQFEEASIDTYNFYSQTVLKTFAAVIAKEKSKDAKGSTPQ